MPIHPTAIIGPEAQIDSTVSVGPYSIIESGVRVGAGTEIGPFVHLLGATTIGERCRIHARVSIGDTPQDVSYKGARTGCQIGNDTTVREGVTIHRGSHEGTTTVVGDRCILMVNSHVGHNCLVGNDVWLVNGVLLAGHVEVGNKAVISGNTGVHQFCRIGQYAMISGMSKITRDIPPYCMAHMDGTCIGLNTIGLRRAGFGPEVRNELKEAYKVIFRQTISAAKAADELEKFVQSEPGREMIAFLRVKSKRGLTSGPRGDIEPSAE
jgi:UDP-N-acetylglucosamine acyltransferase